MFNKFYLFVICLIIIQKIICDSACNTKSFTIERHYVV